MTEPPSGNTTPDDYRATALDYQQRLGWPAFAQGTIVWMAPGYAADAFNVPRAAGEWAMGSLRSIGVEAPVINIPGPPDRWAVLVQPHGDPADDILRLLVGRDIGYAHGGRYEGRPSAWGIDLPPTRHPGHEPLTWVNPADTPLPRLSLVVNAILATGVPDG